MDKERFRDRLGDVHRLGFEVPSRRNLRVSVME